MSTLAHDDLDRARQLLIARAALAQDLKRDPATMAAGLDRGYRLRPHLRVIGDAVAGVLRGDYDRLLILTPPQVGKSSLAAEWGPFWWLTHRPDDDIIVASYAADLAETRSQAIRGLVARHGHEYGLRLRRGSSAARDWRLESGGHLRAVGVGGGLSGFPANCVAYDTSVRTPSGPLPIGVYVESGCTDPVLAFDHTRGVPVWSPVVATSTTERDTIEVVTQRGRIIRCTPDHRIYIPGRGYVPAATLRPGDPLCTSPAQPDPGGVRMRPVRGSVPAGSGRGRQGPAPRFAGALLLPGLQQPGALPGEDVPGVWHRADQPAQDVLLGAMPPGPEPDLPGLPRLRTAVPGQELRPRQERPQRAANLHLFEAVPRHDVRSRSSVPTVRNTGPERTPVLLCSMQARQPCGDQQDPNASRHHLPHVRKDLPTAIEPGPILLPTVRQPGAQPEANRSRQLPLQERQVVCVLVPGNAPADHGAGGEPLRDVRNPREAGGVCPPRQDVLSQRLPRPSHQRGPGGQPAGEPGRPVRHVSRDTPPLDGDAVAEVRRVRDGRVRVYDLQVEGTHNFFAGEVLVHNCLIVDDPHANRAEAGSPRIRNGVHEWWSSTASTRLQPDMGAVIAIQTRWHEDDFAGRRLAEEGRLEEGGRWKVVHLPAVADPKFGADPLGREPGEPLTHPKIPTRDRVRLSSWWEEKKRTSMVRDWHSLYQGDPQPVAGALATYDLIRAITDAATEVEPQKIGVAVDPSGGGRDVAGIVGGFLGDDARLHITHDVSGVMSSEDWSLEACRLAYDTDASVIIVETNFGADMALLVVRTAWKHLVDTGEIPAEELPPRIRAVRAKQGKLLRAEPIAQQMYQDRIRLRGVFPDLSQEWCSWQPSDPSSPGRIDASVYLAYGLLPIPSTGVEWAAPTGQMPATSPSPLSGPGGGASGMGPLG